ncbi:hypothetical protein K227x_07770 [Rubripirellula lacrimiformis]|uniref:Uncharacterized protein n=1 Tax=Rubripirellula lacrimiformis TaxID=1930273 RepID=A0A517N5L3_9BACT|nr:hypothetical protein K227x_07770 [Rubripirellula lacrimiformis]
MTQDWEDRTCEVGGGDRIVQIGPDFARVDASVFHYGYRSEQLEKNDVASPSQPLGRQPRFNAGPAAISLGEAKASCRVGGPHGFSVTTAASPQPSSPWITEAPLR